MTIHTISAAAIIGMTASGAVLTEYVAGWRSFPAITTTGKGVVVTATTTRYYAQGEQQYPHNFATTHSQNLP
jgi:hypothetical protein